MTAKKKHLIELMIESGVKWPDGAEYVAQDKDKWLAFYTRKPYREDGKVTWSSYRCYVANSMKKLDLLCRNWHRTIVTREQYAEAVAAADNGSTTNQVRESEDVPASQPAAKYCASVMRQMPDETIESLLAEIKAKREKRDALVAKADALALEIASIEQRVNDKLKEYGFAMFQLAAASEPEQLAITDWRDLRVGDVIVIDYIDVDPVRKKALEGAESVIVRDGAEYPICATNKNYPRGQSWFMGGPAEIRWRFIRRP